MRTKLARPTGDSSSDSVLSELLSLRKKYDAVVEYTVHLTAERDSVVAQLEEVHKELGRDRLKRRGEDGSVDGGAGAGNKSALKRVSHD